MTGSQRFRGRVAIVTGAGSGIGRATAERFASEGAFVILGDLNDAGLRETAAGIGTNAIVQRCDVTNEDDVQALVEAAVSRHGRVDILANVAGISPPVKPEIDKISLADFTKVISVNLIGTFLTIKHVSAIMKRQMSGKIVNVASIAGIQPTSKNNGPYTSSKGGVAALTRQMVLDLAPYGINVNSVAPGVTRTAMTERRGAAMLDMKAKAIPIGRVGLPEDIAAAIAFLASDEASFIAGHMLVVDGGMTAAVFAID